MRIRPNLVLVNNTLPDMHIAEISARLKAQLGTDAPPLLALTELAISRESLLRSGVEDVLTLPVDHKFLIARIRSVLRKRASEADWRLHDSTTRALGFAEPMRKFDHSISVLCMHGEDGTAPDFVTESSDHPGLRLQCSAVNAAMRNPTVMQSASVIVLALQDGTPDRVLSTLSDLRASQKTCHSAIMVVVPTTRPELAAQALDLGADDAALADIPASEFHLRLQRLNTRRETNKGLRNIVKSGAEAATLDPLTGLYNRRYALPHLERVTEQARISGRPFAVMIADLDHFKQVNDWHGHDVGDAVLVECANRLKANIRETDLLARIGGEEFLFVMPNSDQHTARDIANRLCRKIAQTPISLPNSHETVPMTVSIGLVLASSLSTGLAQSSPKRLTPSDLLTRADKALYQAKETGRNRFMLEQSAAA